MRIDTGHWLEGARRLPTDHCNARPGGQQPSLIVLHGISLPPGQFGGSLIDELFTGRLPAATAAELRLTGVRVSSHVLIDRSGAITQYVPFDKRAWHAGVSAWQGRSNCNDFAIGIELEGTDAGPYANAQYGTLTELLQALMQRYPRLAPDALVGHLEVAPGRKTDPGPGFDWQRVLLALY